MKIIYILLISLIFVSLGFAQEKPEKIKSTKNQSSYSKEKEKNIKEVELRKDIQNKQSIDSSKESGPRMLKKRNKSQNKFANKKLKK